MGIASEVADVAVQGMRDNYLARRADEKEARTNARADKKAQEAGYLSGLKESRLRDRLDHDIGKRQDAKAQQEIENEIKQKELKDKQVNTYFKVGVHDIDAAKGLAKENNLDRIFGKAQPTVTLPNAMIHKDPDTGLTSYTKVGPNGFEVHYDIPKEGTPEAAIFKEKMRLSGDANKIFNQADDKRIRIEKNLQTLQGKLAKISSGGGGKNMFEGMDFGDDKGMKALAVLSASMSNKGSSWKKDDPEVKEFVKLAKERMKRMREDIVDLDEFARKISPYTRNNEQEREAEKSRVGTLYNTESKNVKQSNPKKPRVIKSDLSREELKKKLKAERLNFGASGKGRAAFDEHVEKNQLYQ